MTVSKLDIWNRALSACRAKGRLSSLTENSFEREVCEEWYDVVLGTVQEAVLWDSGRVTARLPLLAERDYEEDWQPGDPDTSYTFSYGLPENYLRARQLSEGANFVTGFDDTRNRRNLSTNAENAILIYAKLNEDVTRWSEGQKLATIYGLAAQIAFPLSGLNAMVEKNVVLANNILESAQTFNANNTTEPEQAVAPWHIARGAVELALSPFFTYPRGQFFALPVDRSPIISATLPDAVN